MIPPLDPVAELIAVVRAAGVAELALGIDRPQADSSIAQLGDQTITRASTRFTRRSRTRILARETEA
jgi:hypothetical protein